MQLRTGLQPNHTYFATIDIDAHRPGQDALGKLADIQDVCTRAGPVGRALLDKLVIVRSTSGYGYQLLFDSPIPLQSRTLYAGRHPIGELICVGGPQRANVPQPGRCVQGSLTSIPLLSMDELRILLGAVGAVHLIGEGPQPPRVRCADRRAEGHRLVGDGWEREDTPPLRTFLAQHRIGRDLLALLDGSKRGLDRSRAHARLVQHLLLRGPELGDTPHTIYRKVMKLAIEGWAYGKGDSKDYRIVEDTYGLIGKIVRGDPMEHGGRWIVPHWLQERPTRRTSQVAATARPTAPARRTPGRPAGSRAARIDRLSRLLYRMARTAQADDPCLRRGFRGPALSLPFEVPTSIAMLAQKVHVAERTLQTYLASLRANGEIATYQQDGNGRLIILLTIRFRYAEKAPKGAQKSADRSPRWHADNAANDSVPMPEKAAHTPQCIEEEEHQKPGAAPDERASGVATDGRSSGAAPGALGLPDAKEGSEEWQVGAGRGCGAVLAPVSADHLCRGDIWCAIWARGPPWGRRRDEGRRRRGWVRAKARRCEGRTGEL
jgi:hypothetical protein